MILAEQNVTIFLLSFLFLARSWVLLELIRTWSESIRIGILSVRRNGRREGEVGTKLEACERGLMEEGWYRSYTYAYTVCTWPGRVGEGWDLTGTINTCHASHTYARSSIFSHLRVVVHAHIGERPRRYAHAAVHIST